MARRQRDLVTTAQLLNAGLSDGAISHRVARGALVRVHRGVYTLSHAPLPREAVWLAAVLACRGLSALAGLAAAELIGISRFRARKPEVVSTRRRTLDGVAVHLCRRLDPRDITTRQGIPVTTVHRTLVDLADALTAHQLANVIHEAAFRGWFVEPAVRDAMARVNGRRNVRVLERAIALHCAGSAGTRSGAEDAFLTLDLPEPFVNMDLAGEEVDFHWPRHGVAVEVDGPGHGRSPTRRADERRDAALQAAGYAVLRFTDAEVRERPGMVRDRVAAALVSSPGRRRAA